MREAIFIIGPQGSGKGTQAKMLAASQDYRWFEMSSAIREYAAREAPDAAAIRSQIERGVLLDDETILSITEKMLLEMKDVPGIIFDGVPRRIRQAESFLAWLGQNGFTRFTTIFLNVPRDVSVGRMMLRAKTENRADDTPERIAYRLDQYQAETAPVVDYLGQHTDLHEVDGRPGIEDVTREIKSVLGIQ